MDKSKAANEYAVQLFNYPSKTITDFLIGTIDSVVIEGLEVMQESLMSSTIFADVPKENHIRGFELLTKRYQQKMETISSKLERFLLETIFKIPDHVLLPEDTAQRTKHTAKGHKKLLKEIESIKKEIEMEKYKKVVFKGKLKEATETLENFKSTASQIEATSQQVLKENQTMKIQENAEFIQKKVDNCKIQLIGLQGLVPEETTDNTSKVFRQLKEEDMFKPVRARRN